MIWQNVKRAARLCLDRYAVGKEYALRRSTSRILARPNRQINHHHTKRRDDQSDNRNAKNARNRGRFYSALVDLPASAKIQKTYVTIERKVMKCPAISQSMLYVPFIEGTMTIEYAARGLMMITPSMLCSMTQKSKRNTAYGTVTI